MQTNKNHRIVFTSIELDSLGRFFDKEVGSKWMTYEECLASKFMNEDNARIIQRQLNQE